MHWHEADKRGLEKIKRQAEREGGRILTLSENNAAGDASQGLSSEGKDNTIFADNQISKEAKRLSVEESANKQRADAESSADATPQFSVGKTNEGRVGTAEAYDVAAGLVKSAGLDVVEVSNEVEMEMFEKKILPSMVSRIALMRNRPQGVFLRLTVEVLPQMPLTLAIFPQR